MKATAYDYDIVNGFWRKAAALQESLKTTIETNRAKWEAANQACTGVPAIPSICTYLSRAADVCESIGEAIENGIKLNEQYYADMQEVAGDINLE